MEEGLQLRWFPERSLFFSRMKGETPVNSTMSIGQARKMVEQLKIEASLCRIKVGGTLAGSPISWPGRAVLQVPKAQDKRCVLSCTP